jgi:hypothetical protein
LGLCLNHQTHCRKFFYWYFHLLCSLFLIVEGWFFFYCFCFISFYLLFKRMSCNQSSRVGLWWQGLCFSWISLLGTSGCVLFLIAWEGKSPLNAFDTQGQGRGCIYHISIIPDLHLYSLSWFLLWFEWPLPNSGWKKKFRGITAGRY